MPNQNNFPEWDPRRLDEWIDSIRVFVRERLRWVILGVVGLVFFITAYYQVEPSEVGVVMRFGKYSRTTNPGPHFKWPFGIEHVEKVPVQRQLKQEFGFRTLQSAVRTTYGRDDDTHMESLMLTGDLNVANVEWIVQYKIRSAYKYLFRVRNVTQTFRDMAEASMRQVVGDHSVTEVLTVGREEIQEKAKQHLQTLCDKYETGLEVLQLVLQDVNPPLPVRDSFNEVNQSIQERERAINQAWAKYNQVIPEARGKAAQELQTAQGYAIERTNRAKGDAARFVDVEAAYSKAPQVTKTRLYLETMAAVLPKAEKRVVIDSSLKGLLPILSVGEKKQ